jgi:hypothetical protein
MAADAILHHERFTHIFSNQKFLKILCTINSLCFNGKQFSFFFKEVKSREKKLRNFLMGKYHGKSWLIFFLEILPCSTKNKNCFPLKLND